MLVPSEEGVIEVHVSFAGGDIDRCGMVPGKMLATSNQRLTFVIPLRLGLVEDSDTSRAGEGGRYQSTCLPKSVRSALQK